MKTRGIAISRGKTNRARALRRNATDEERLLWSRLKEYRSQSIAFRRQVPLGPYVVDFLCRKADLIVELDGDHHGDPDQSNSDIRRDLWLEQQGYTVLRYWNSMIWTDMVRVLDDIDGYLREKSML